VSRKNIRTQGQIAVVIALSMVVLLLFVALTIDGTNAFHQRRRCQNAVDSAAIAGIVERTSAGTTNQKVHNVCVEYVTQHIGTPDAFEARYTDSSNTKLNAILSYGAVSAPPATGVGIWVWAQNKYGMFFGRLAGQSQKTSSASAIAKSGTIGAMGGVMPIGLDEDLLANVTVGQEIEIWDDDKIFPAGSNGNGNGLTGQANGNRGWLNFNYVYSYADPTSRTDSHSHSNADLKGWIDDPDTGPTIVAGPYVPANGKIPLSYTGDFVNGDSGTRASAIQEMTDWIGYTVYIPIYDRIVDLPGDLANGYPAPGLSFANGPYFHIVGFAAFTVTGTKATGNPKWIKGRFVSKTLDGTVGGGLTGTEPGAITAISLAK